MSDREKREIVISGTVRGGRPRLVRTSIGHHHCVVRNDCARRIGHSAQDVRGRQLREGRRGKQEHERQETPRLPPSWQECASALPNLRIIFSFLDGTFISVISQMLRLLR